MVGLVLGGLALLAFAWASERNRGRSGAVAPAFSRQTFTPEPEQTFTPEPESETGTVRPIATPAGTPAVTVAAPAIARPIAQTPAPIPIVTPPAPSPTQFVQNPNVIAYGMGVLEVPLVSGAVENIPYQSRDPRLPAGSIIQNPALIAVNNAMPLEFSDPNPGGLTLFESATQGGAFR